MKDFKSAMVILCGLVLAGLLIYFISVSKTLQSTILQIILIIAVIVGFIAACTVDIKEIAEKMRKGKMLDEASWKMYLFNVIICTDEGTYRVKKIAKWFAQDLWKSKEKENRVSAIGHEATATLFSLILGDKIDVNRIPAVMNPGDQAICLKMRGRIPEGTVITDMAELEKIGYDLFWMIREA